MNEFTFRFMDKRPFKALGADGVRSARSSRPSWNKSIALLRFELAKIGAKEIVIEAGYPQNQIRNDGWPYSSAKPVHSQVRVSFRRDKVPMSFFQGGFDAFEYNLWLIGQTLKALRALDRYGCTQSGEQYRGWAQLPSGISAAEWASVEDAMRFLSKVGEGPVLSVFPRDLTVVYRQAAKRAHPDTPGGSAELMSKVNRAKDYIERAGK